MPTCSWPSLTFAFAVLYVILLIYNHYTFPAPISSPWSSCCSETVVLVQQGLDLPQSRRTAKDLRQVGNHITLSILDSLLASKPRWSFNHGSVPAVASTRRLPAHVLRASVVYTSTTGMAVGPDHMAQLGSTTKSEDTTCTKCQVYKFESNGSHRSHRSNRSHRGGESSSKQPKEAHKPAQSSPTSIQEEHKYLPWRCCRWAVFVVSGAPPGLPTYPGCNQCLHRPRRLQPSPSAEKQLRTLTGMLNVVLPDLPRHITPLLIHHLDDFVILFQERPCA